MAQLKFSKKESDRFKMNIYRGTLDKIDKNSLKELKLLIIKHSIDTVIFRVPTERMIDISKLDKLGFNYIVTDTLVYYSVNFKKYNIPNYRNYDLKFTKINENNINELSYLVDEIFVGYSNHYKSNPFFNEKDIIEGYKEWSRNLIDEENNKIGWLISRNNKYIGFATCLFDIEQDISEGVLYGVIPSASGGGVYSDIIRFTQKYFKDNGLSKMKVSTQIQNYAVQKVWSREGFVLSQAYNTIHINSLLSYSVLKEKNIDIEITKKNIDDFGKTSGDLNEIHFNDEYATEIGLNGRIAHGLISNAILSKFYGTEFPGKGTLFLSYKYIFYSPIYPDKKYHAKISFPYYNNKNNRYLSVAKVLDTNNNICLISYNELLKK